MISSVTHHIEALENMRAYPKNIYYSGDIALLEKEKISIVGSRKPSQYTKEMTYILSQKLVQAGFCIVSGAAMGVDAIAHTAAGKNTIAVMANGLDIIYPKINKNLIENINEYALSLSTYDQGVIATKYSFVHRNELVVALGNSLIVTQADLNSGSMHSVKFAQMMGKKIYVLSQRVGESDGTNALVSELKAEVISDIDYFVHSITDKKVCSEPLDKLLEFCKTNSNYDVVVSHFGEKVFEYELEGKIVIENSKVIPL